jgi:hypothetical protein
MIDRFAISNLTGENCQLLQVRNTVLMGESAERVAASTQQWSEWKNVLDWVLSSEGGHNTAPHMDSHAFATCITAQEGSIGFGWMLCPTEEEQNSWTTDPHCYTGGQWRYIVLKPGQSVFFMPGTINFVFRVRDRQTLWHLQRGHSGSTAPCNMLASWMAAWPFRHKHAAFAFITARKPFLRETL